MFFWILLSKSHNQGTRNDILRRSLRGGRDILIRVSPTATKLGREYAVDGENMSA
jgi:hypothetical protein